MNSKINELRNLIRKEIKKALSEDLGTDIKKAKDVKMQAIKKLADLEKKKADIDVKNAQKGIS
jgi:hypothetical protein